MVFQNSTINALAEGHYEGDISFGQLKQYGNFGLGTFHNIDGEMIGFDGVFYQIKSDGKIVEVEDEQKTPFSVVTNFETDKKVTLNEPTSYDSLKEYLNTILPSDNFIYAIRINGTFKDVVTRSVPKTNSGVRLVDVIPDQSIFEYDGKMKGTIVGFYFPSFMKDINVVGYHFHILSDDRLKGGHLLDLNVEEAEIHLDYIHDFRMILPLSEQFEKLDLTKIKDGELDTIEKK